MYFIFKDFSLGLNLLCFGFGKTKDCLKKIQETPKPYEYFFPMQMNLKLA